MGFEHCEIRFYDPSRCMLTARRREGEIHFKRGINWDFQSIHDVRERSMDVSVIAPAPWNESLRVPRDKAG